MLDVCASELITGACLLLDWPKWTTCNTGAGRKSRQLCLHIAGYSRCHISWYMLCCFKKKSPLCYKIHATLNFAVLGEGREWPRCTVGTVDSRKPLEAQWHVAVSNEKQTTPAAAGEDTRSLFTSLFPLSHLVSLSSEKQEVVVSADDETSGRLT